MNAGLFAEKKKHNDGNDEDEGGGEDLETDPGLGRAVQARGRGREIDDLHDGVNKYYLGSD